MSLDADTPVLVGIAAVEQRRDDPRDAAEPWELMARALELAAEDAGSRRLLERASSIRVPRGFWRYGDPGRLVADRIGAAGAHTTLAEIGVLQQTLIGDACRAIASGREEIALVTGGEARYREQRARVAGVELVETQQPGVSADRVLAPSEALFAELELQRGLMMPVRAFAIIDNALRFAERQELEAHRDEIARLWSELSEIAARNPHAWYREPVSPEQVREAGPGNRMMAFPYTRRHNSDWNVDQAAGLLLCSVDRARALGIPESRWVFPLASTECNHVVPLAARRALHRSPGAARAGARALEWAGTEAESIDHLELYSCFPAAVRVFQRELGVDAKRPPSVTGGMAFAGGPLNNYVLQATVRMAEVLRADPGSKGIVTSVSGFLNKQGIGVWSSEPVARGFGWADCTAEVAAEEGEGLELVGDHDGPATIASYTVVYHDDAPLEGIAVCDLPDGRRTIGVARDPSLLDAMVTQEFCGRDVRVARDGALSAD